MASFRRGRIRGCNVGGHFVLLFDMLKSHSSSLLKLKVCQGARNERGFEVIVVEGLTRGGCIFLLPDKVVLLKILTNMRSFKAT